jgi:uridine kinase
MVQVTTQAVLLLSRIIEARHPLLVAIDGPSGAGKSTLARAVSRRQPAQIVQMDEFYRVMDPDLRVGLSPSEGVDRYFDWRRLQKEVLEPLCGGRRACYQRYDWSTNDLGAWKEIEPSQVTLVEGVYSARPELTEFMDLRVLVETPPAVRLNRQIQRNENSLEWVRRWAKAERLYFSEILPRAPVDLVIAGE